MEEHRNTNQKRKTTSSTSKVILYIALVVGALFFVLSFFAITTMLSKPQSMDLGTINKEKTDDVKVAPERTITLLVDNTKVIRYIGTFESPIEKPKEFEYGENGIRKELLRLKSSITKEGKDNRVVLIKMAKNIDYKKMVEILDEMAFTKVPTYALVDITPEEQIVLNTK